MSVLATKDFPAAVAVTVLFEVFRRVCPDTFGSTLNFR